MPLDVSIDSGEEGLIQHASPLLACLWKQVQTHPEKTAFLDGEKATAYDDLWRAAMRWRNALQDCIQPGDRVALLMDNSAEAAAGGYGIWAAQGVWVGLNTGLKQEDLLWQIAHCGARVLITGDRYKALAEAAAAAGVQVMQPGEAGIGGDHPRAAPASPEPANADMATPAAIIYTSGTTGLPKGVLLTHASLAANVSAIQLSLPIQPDDVTLCLLPFFYAYGFSVLHTHLSMGATLVLEHSLMYPQKVLQRMTDTRATAFYGVPSSYYLLLERGHLARAELASLRYCAQAGGAMDPARADEVCDTLPHVAFYVMYGQTEACSRLTTLPAAMRRAKPGSVGRALAGITLSIQSEDGTLLAPKQIGEVCAQGPNVMHGYWQAPDDTSRTLRDGWLHTGDLGYLDEDGFLFLTGRSREQIKTGAHRVSPWEIEQLIQTVPGVREAAVVGQPDHLLGEIVHAYVIADTALDTALDTAVDTAVGTPSDMLRKAIMQACKTRLAPYKIPKHLSFVPAFPRTASGKVQKHLLALPITPPGPASRS